MIFYGLPPISEFQAINNINFYYYKKNIIKLLYYVKFVIVTEALQCNKMTATGQDTDNKNNVQMYNRWCTKKQKHNI